jgi:hypothetical protein
MIYNIGNKPHKRDATGCISVVQVIIKAITINYHVNSEIHNFFI